MQREMGIDQLDLQHAYELDERPGTRPGICRCGRSLEHDLHVQPAIQQTASYSGPTIETEKGS